MLTSFEVIPTVTRHITNTNNTKAPSDVPVVSARSLYWTRLLTYVKGRDVRRRGEGSEGGPNNTVNLQIHVNIERVLI